MRSKQPKISRLITLRLYQFICAFFVGFYGYYIYYLVSLYNTFHEINQCYKIIGAIALLILNIYLLIDTSIYINKINKQP